MNIKVQYLGWMDDGVVGGSCVRKEGVEVCAWWESIFYLVF